MTLYYEDLTPGLSDSITRTITEADVDAFGALSGDMNPLHFDEAFARKTIARHRIVHGALLVGQLSAVIGNKLPGPGTIVLSLQTAFKGSVRINDTVTAVCTVREVLPKRRAIITCICKVGETVVVEGEGLVLVPAKP